ncbi:class A beta-lactamase [Qipengyuania sp. JC766]|uniref:class A beta-lactamase n=1 Tax=Qipengyuania sp. JC766 TaxID=3232139 RepID=UPI003457C371
MTLSRRHFLAGTGALGVAACTTPGGSDGLGPLRDELAAAELRGNGTLSVSILDTGSGRSLSHAGYARVAHCSSFKLSLAALVMQRIRAGTLDANETLRWSETDLVEYSPVTQGWTARGATPLELAEATQKTSDNTAANVLLKRLGGPEELTRFWRALGDESSRLDRYEPELNHVPPGEIMDTTTPDAMAMTVAKLLTGDVLAPEDRRMLRQWTIDTQTGLQRVRAGLPQGWVAGDKTGTSLWPDMRSIYVDVGFAQPPGRPPIVFAAYFRSAGTDATVDPVAQNVFAEVGTVLARFAALAGS